MRFLAALCMLVASTTAQHFGPSGIVMPNGQNIQFAHGAVSNIAVAGPSGIVTKDGRNIQLTDAGILPEHVAALTPAAPAPRSAAPLGELIQSGALVGQSGIVNPDGRNVQFTHDQAQNIVLVGPSGIVTADGQNIQLRSKRSVGFVSANGNVGTSGILRADGTTTLFDHDTAHNIVLIGPSGIVGKNGNMQFTADLQIAHSTNHPAVSQYRPEDIALEGASGIILKDGTLIQKRAKRSAPLLVGASGMILADGTPVQFKTAGATIVLDGPSGMLLSDGTQVQKRGKRSAPLLVGASGMILADGTPVQFKTAGTTVLLDGPSGMILSDGTLVQKRA